MKEQITVIGGGISGITTGIVLQLLGYETVCYAEHLVEKKTSRDPRFASLYPAASVIPHSVKSEYLNSLFPASLNVFKTLHENSFGSISKHRHYELFEFPKKAPSYTAHLNGCASIEDLPDTNLPRRKNADKLHGWAFDCFIAKWPAYMNKMYALYKKSGGVILRKKIKRNDVASLPSDLIINCSGVWSNNLFEDTVGHKVIRGHVLHTHHTKTVRDHKNRICSYNYMPRSSVYATPQDNPCDVYFYPIRDKWIFGGSRQVGSLNDDGKWEGSENDQTVIINNVKIPRQIFDLNTEILQNTYQIDLKKTDNLKAYCGYRFERDDPKNGLRLEATEQFGKKVIHNYGHGGAGVTLSWGCALKVFNLINESTAEREANFDNSILKTLQLQLHKVYSKYYF